MDKCSFVRAKKREMMNDSGVVRFHVLEPFAFSREEKAEGGDYVLDEGRRANGFESLDYIFCSDEYLLVYQSVVLTT